MNPSRLFILRPVATVAADGRDPAGGHRRLSRAAAVGAAAGRLPDDPGRRRSIPGASPEVMASSVTAPLERQFGQMPGLDADDVDERRRRVGRSRCSSPSSSTLDVAEQEVQAAINAGGDAAAGATCRRRRSTARSIPADAPILTLAVTSTTLPLPQVQDLVDTRLAQKISQVSGRRPGHASAAASGRRCASRPTRRRSRRYGLTLEDLRTAIAARQRQPGQGQLRRPDARVHDRRQRPAADPPTSTAS